MFRATGRHTADKPLESPLPDEVHSRVTGWIRARLACDGRPKPVGELLICLTVAVAIVLFRSWVPTAFERFDFDSDQAIVGLMAKHFSELRAFPLFFYGQNYMLGVQSWIAVPFFWVGGPSLVMLRMPLIILNAVVALTIMVVFVRSGMRPRVALVATLPLIATTPVVSAALIEALGVSIEPLAYVLLLWSLRRRAVMFGAVFCVTFLHREFAAFAAVAIAFIAWRDRSISAAAVARAAASFAGVWLLIDSVKGTVNIHGPAGAPFQGGTSLLLEVEQLSILLSLDPRYYWQHLVQLLTQGLPHMMGARPHLIHDYGMVSTTGAGSAAAGAAIGAGLLLAAWRVGVARRGVDAAASERRIDRFTLYLALVGLQSVLAYGMKRGMSTEVGIVINYVLLALFLPVALLAVFFQRERSSRYRAAVSLLVCVWACLNLVDNALLLREYLVSPPENNFREMADYLITHRIK